MNPKHKILFEYLNSATQLLAIVMLCIFLGAVAYTTLSQSNTVEVVNLAPIEQRLDMLEASSTQYGQRLNGLETSNRIMTRQMNDYLFPGVYNGIH